MSKKSINEMSLEELFEKTDVIIKVSDIISFCEDEDVIMGFLQEYKRTRGNFRALKQYLIDHEYAIKKEELIFRLYLNYKENLKQIESNFESLKLSATENFEKIEKLLEQQKVQKEKMQVTKSLAKKLDTYIIETEFKNGEMEFNIISSKEEFSNRRFSEKKKLEKWNKIDEEVSDDGNGSIYLLQTILLTDLSAILPNYNIGMELRECILDNALFKSDPDGIIELEQLKKTDIEEYNKKIENVRPEDYFIELRKELIKNIRFIDIDKLLLLCAYRFEDSMDRGLFRQEDIGVIRELLKYIQSQIENKNIRFEEILQEKESYEEINVKYSYKDLEKCIQRFIGDTYISKSEIQQATNNLLSGKETIEDFDAVIINLMDISEQEIRQIAGYGLPNFQYAIEKLNYSEEEILESIRNNPSNATIDCISELYNSGRVSMDSIIDLYSDNIIDQKFFIRRAKKTDIASDLSIKRIHDLYMKIKQQEKQNGQSEQNQQVEEDKKHLNAEIELYKAFNINGKEQEEIEKQAYDAMYDIAENFEDEKDLLYYYENGVLTLDVVAEWGGDELIDELYNTQKIGMQEIETLCETGKISKSEFEKIVLGTEWEYSQLLKYMYLDYIREETIVDLFIKGKLREINFRGLFEHGKISVQQYDEGMEKRTLEVLQENSNASIECKDCEFSARSLSKIHLEIDGNVEPDSDGGNGHIKNPETLIDPNIRYEFLKTLGTQRITMKNMNSTNDFYNYEFFIIPGADGKLKPNSVIIGERFYEDKTTQERFATSNATYFFQCQDALINSNMPKKDILHEQNKTIFRASHRLGSWAINVLYKIAQTSSASDFSECKTSDEVFESTLTELEKIYSEEQLRKIIKIVDKIDRDPKYWYDVVYEKDETYNGSNVGEDDEER